jgi:hypothetical protein
MVVVTLHERRCGFAKLPEALVDKSLFGAEVLPSEFEFFDERCNGSDVMELPVITVKIYT